MSHLGDLRRVILELERDIDSLFHLLRAEIDADDQGKGGKESGAELQPPRDSTGLVDRQVGTVAQEDAESRPHLPGHHQGPADLGGTVFGGENGDGRALETHTDAEKQANDEELVPVLSAGGTDRGQDTEKGGDEDGTAAAEIVVARVREPSADEGRAEIGTRIDETDQPVVPLLMRSTGCGPLADAELFWETEVGSVGSEGRCQPVCDRM